MESFLHWSFYLRKLNVDVKHFSASWLMVAELNWTEFQLHSEVVMDLYLIIIKWHHYISVNFFMLVGIHFLLVCVWRLQKSVRSRQNIHSQLTEFRYALVFILHVSAPCTGGWWYYFWWRKWKLHILLRLWSAGSSFHPAALIYVDISTRKKIISTSFNNTSIVAALWRDVLFKESFNDMHGKDKWQQYSSHSATRKKREICIWLLVMGLEAAHLDLRGNKRFGWD